MTTPLIEIIDNYREAQGAISDRELERRFGMSSGTMAKIRKRGAADVDTLQAIAKATGRTVGQLLGEKGGGDPNAPDDITMIPIDQIDPGTNPRTRGIDPLQVEQLAASIFDQGLTNPLLVRPTGAKEAGRYELIAGQRRRLAILHLIANGEWAKNSRVPCTVKDVDDRQAKILALTENLQRSDMDPLDEADGFKAMQDEGMSAEDIAKALHKELRYVQQRIALVKKLPEQAKQDLRAGKITVTQAREMVTKPRASHADKKTNAVRRSEPIPKKMRAADPVSHPKAIKAPYEFTSVVSRGADGPMPTEITLWDPTQCNEARYIRADRATAKAPIVGAINGDETPTQAEAKALGVPRELQRPDLRDDSNTDLLDIPASLRRRKKA